MNCVNWHSFHQTWWGFRFCMVFQPWENIAFSIGERNKTCTRNVRKPKTQFGLIYLTQLDSSVPPGGRLPVNALRPRRSGLRQSSLGPSWFGFWKETARILKTNIKTVKTTVNNAGKMMTSWMFWQNIIFHLQTSLLGIAHVIISNFLAKCPLFYPWGPKRITDVDVGTSKLSRVAFRNAGFLPCRCLFQLICPNFSEKTDSLMLSWSKDYFAVSQHHLRKETNIATRSRIWFVTRWVSLLSSSLELTKCKASDGAKVEISRICSLKRYLLPKHENISCTLDVLQLSFHERELRFAKHFSNAACASDSLVGKQLAQRADHGGTRGRGEPGRAAWHWIKALYISQWFEKNRLFEQCVIYFAHALFDVALACWSPMYGRLRSNEHGFG